MHFKLRDQTEQSMNVKASINTSWKENMRLFFPPFLFIKMYMLIKPSNKLLSTDTPKKRKYKVVHIKIQIISFFLDKKRKPQLKMTLFLCR